MFDIHVVELYSVYAIQMKYFRKYFVGKIKDELL